MPQRRRYCLNVLLKHDSYTQLRQPYVDIYSDENDDTWRTGPSGNAHAPLECHGVTRDPPVRFVTRPCSSVRHYSV